MAKESSNKGNPAHRRMSNPKLKARRAASWARGQRKKAARVKAQKEREAFNAELREAGEPTPWEQSKALRFAKRAVARAYVSERGAVVIE